MVYKGQAQNLLGAGLEAVFSVVMIAARYCKLWPETKFMGLRALVAMMKGALLAGGMQLRLLVLCGHQCRLQ